MSSCHVLFWWHKGGEVLPSLEFRLTNSRFGAFYHAWPVMHSTNDQDLNNDAPERHFRALTPLITKGIMQF